MISITERSEAALTAMAELALGGSQPLPVSELGRRSGVSVPLLEQLLPALRRSRLVESRRGVKGGYLLTRPAGQINALEIVEAIEGALTLPGDKLPPWETVVGELRANLEALDLAGVAAAREASAGGPMYYI